MECIDKYGSKLCRLNYGAETVALKHLTRDLQTDAACIKALVQQMQATNLKFEDLFIARLEEYSEYEGKTTRELTQLTTETYRTLVQYIEAHALLSPSRKYTSLINLMNENIEHYNQVVERRKQGGEVVEEDMITDADTSTDVPMM